MSEKWKSANIQDCLLNVFNSDLTAHCIVHMALILTNQRTQGYCCSQPGCSVCRAGCSECNRKKLQMFSTILLLYLLFCWQLQSLFYLQCTHNIKADHACKGNRLLPSGDCIICAFLVVSGNSNMPNWWKVVGDCWVLSYIMREWI